MSLLGLDIGITGCKAVVFDEEGNVLSHVYCEYSLLHPKPRWTELNPDFLWGKVKEVVFKAATQARSDPIRALSISTQGETMVPVSKDDKPLYNFIITFDNRTEPQFQRWQEEIGKEEIFQITGIASTSDV